MPLYNKEAYIRRTLDSVLHQSEGDFELLIIDDGSTDAGPSIAEATGDTRVKVHRFPNGGVSAARNRGIALASSELVAFLDADDHWEPAFLADTLEELEKNKAAVAVFCNIVEPQVPQGCLPRGGKPVVISDYPAWFVAHKGLGLWSSNTVARKGALQACGLFPVGVNNGEDTDTWLRLSFEGPVIYLPHPWAWYLTEDEDSLSKRYKAVRPRAIESLEEILEKKELSPARRNSTRRAISYFWLAYGTALAQAGDRVGGFKAMARARLSPLLARPLLRCAYALARGV
jgi:glycosyltransferase involved in cell wall biosynthesis